MMTPMVNDCDLPSGHESCLLNARVELLNSGNGGLKSDGPHG